MSSSPKKIVLLSSQRSQNLGDEAMCTSAIRLLRAEFGSRASILVRGPECLLQIDQENYKAKPIAAALSPGIIRWKKWWVARRERKMHIEASREPWLERNLLWIWFQFWMIVAWLRIQFKVPLPAAAAELIDELASADLVMTVGGGWVNSSFQLTLQESMYAIRVSHLRRPIPVLLLGDQIGPLTSNWDRSSIRRTFSRAQVIAPRDMDSCVLARDLGLPHERLMLFGDWAYASVENTERTTPDAQPLKVALNLRHAHYSTLTSDGLKALVRGLDFVARRQGLVLIPVPMCLSDHENDISALQDFSELLRRNGSQNVTIQPVPRDGNADGMRRLIRECDAAIGVSYHFCLFAMMSGISCLGLSTSEYFSTKLGGLFRLFQASEFVVSMTSFNEIPTRIADWLDQLPCNQIHLNLQNERLSAELAIVRNRIFNEMRQELFGLEDCHAHPMTEGS